MYSSTILLIAVPIICGILLAGFIIERIKREKEREKAYKDFSRDNINRLEKERQRVSMEIHDGIQSQIVVGLLKIERSLKESDWNAVKEAREELQLANKELRTVTKAMWPSGLDQHGIKGSIESLIFDSYSDNMQLDLDMEEVPAGIEQKTYIYRIFQECSSNIIKHSFATRIGVKLRKMNGQIFCRIKDNGIGFDTSKTSESSGLRNIEERVKVMGGTIKIDSSCEGTTITFTIPSNS